MAFKDSLTISGVLVKIWALNYGSLFCSVYDNPQGPCDFAAGNLSDTHVNQRAGFSDFWKSIVRVPEFCSELPHHGLAVAGCRWWSIHAMDKLAGNLAIFDGFNDASGLELDALPSSKWIFSWFFWSQTVRFRNNFTVMFKRNCPCSILDLDLL